MKYLKDRVDNFFKWVKGTELAIIEEIDVSEDPIRPHLDLDFRRSHGRQIYGLEYDGNIEGIVCIAFTNEIPHTEKELELIRKKFKHNDPIYCVVKKKRGRKRNYEESY